MPRIDTNDATNMIFGAQDLEFIGTKLFETPIA